MCCVEKRAALPSFIQIFNKYKLAFTTILITLIGIVYYFWRLPTNYEGIIIEEPQYSTHIKADSASQTPSVKTIIFHIDGAVNNPGVYKSNSEIFLYEAILMAGGLNQSADVNKINLAAQISNRQKIAIPFKVTTHSSKVVHSETMLVNINQATAVELVKLPGIGPSYAKRILDYRNKNGHFMDIKQLLKIKGIGKKKLAKIKKLISI